MFIIDLSKRINRRLIHSFDGNRIKYMFFVFPAYQFLAMIGMALGSFVVRLSGDFLVHEKGKIRPVGLPPCNCVNIHTGCNRVWCVPQQCEPFDCGGRW